VTQTPIQVVAGLLLRPGELLFARRASHQTHGGEWEFPGGKVEPGESREEALTRELLEETGVWVAEALFLLDHPALESNVHLHFYLVTHWLGDPVGREGQHLGWYPRSWFTRLALLPSNRALLDTLLSAIGRHSNLLDQPLTTQS